MARKSGRLFNGQKWSGRLLDSQKWSGRLLNSQIWPGRLKGSSKMVWEMVREIARNGVGGQKWSGNGQKWSRRLLNGDMIHVMVWE